MPRYEIQRENIPVGHINLLNCNCSKFMHLGTDLNNNTMIYNPKLHRIKECLYTSTPALADLSSGFHIVVANDTCFSIANKFCGSNPDLEKVICNYNICTNLQIGTTVYYDCNGKKTNCPPTPAPSNKHGSYKVEKHDTCNKIASK